MLAVGALLSASCAGEDKQGVGCNAAGNPLDAELCKEFDAAGYQPIRASDPELCTRLFVDMIGRRPTKAEIASTCAGRDTYDVVRAFQRTEEYRHTQRRRWADRFQYSEYMVDVHSIKTLDAMVEDLYRQRIGYSDFASTALAHPGFVGRFIGYGQPEIVANAAFEAFLGRSATRPERDDLANLWRSWTGGFFGDDGPPPQPGSFTGDAAFFFGPQPYVDPYACEAGVRLCESTLLGTARVEFPRDGREQFMTPDLLTEADWDALRAPGRLLVTLPMFWEAEVDDVLEKYLGYDLGALRPEARQALVRWFRSTGGDVVRLERAVLTSWAYRQAAVEVPNLPRPASLRDQPFAFGPTKLMIPETWLKSVAALTGDEAGDCDWRYPNLPDWHYPDPLLDEALEDVYPRREDGTIDPWFRNAAASMGGCPGTFDFGSFGARTRSNAMGLMVAVAQEEAIIELCLVRDADGLLPEGVAKTATDEASKRAVVAGLLERTTGRGVLASELDEAMSAAAGECPSCNAEALARDLCTGLVGGIEYVFY